MRELLRFILLSKHTFLVLYPCSCSKAVLTPFWNGTFYIPDHVQICVVAIYGAVKINSKKVYYISSMSLHFTVKFYHQKIKLFGTEFRWWHHKRLLKWSMCDCMKIPDCCDYVCSLVCMEDDHVFHHRQS